MRMSYIAYRQYWTQVVADLAGIEMNCEIKALILGKREFYDIPVVGSRDEIVKKVDKVSVE